jgi:hypothetical protein
VGTNTLSEFIRASLKSNGLVQLVLEQLGRDEDVEIATIIEILRNELPHVDAADNTWEGYALSMAAWMRYAGLVNQAGTVITLREVVGNEMGRKRIFRSGSFGDAFLPGVRPSVVLEALERLRTGPISQTEFRDGYQRVGAALIRAGSAFDLFEWNGAELRAGRRGRALLDSGRALTERDVAELCLGEKNVRAILDALSDKPLGVDEQRQIIERFGTTTWTDLTWKWRLGILRTWIVGTGQARAGRGGLRLPKS